MDSKLLFVSSVVAIELIRLFRTSNDSTEAKKSEVKDASLSETEDVRISELVKALNVLPHPEGGYFIETYRSGAVPMISKGKTDNTGALVDTHDGRQGEQEGLGHEISSSDGTNRGVPRNQMTSIVFMATLDAPILYFGINKSDHVHYFHGPTGCSYTYIVVYPSGEMKELTLGGDVSRGEHLQIVFPGGCFKAGHLNGDHCLIGEAVAPGFDFRDFAFCDEDMLVNRLKKGCGTSTSDDHHLQSLLRRYVQYVKPDRRRNFDDYYQPQKT